MYCKRCGGKLEVNSRFCITCGMEVVDDKTNFTAKEEKQPNKNNKHTIGKIIVICFIIFMIITTIRLVLLMNANHQEDKNTNVYEEESISNNDKDKKDNTNTDNVADKKKYFTSNGFQFEKLDGFDYSEYEDGVLVSNSVVRVMFYLAEEQYSTIKNQVTQLANTYRNDGFEVNNIKTDSYNGIEATTFELTDQGSNAIYFLTKAPNAKFTFYGIILNKNNNFDYNFMKLILPIMENSKYVGVGQSYSKNIDKIELDKLK